MAADAYMAAGEFGAAKVEYDKALEKAEKKSPEKQALIRRLAEKAGSARESLAASHIKAADELIASESLQEAEDLLALAFELTGDEQVKADIKNKTRQLYQPKGEAADASPGEAAGESQEGAPSQAPEEQAVSESPLDTSADEADMGDDDDEEYFHALISTLPEDMQAAYEEYGRAFRDGYIALNRGDFKSAVKYFKEAGREHPSPDTWIPLELATAYINLAQPENARETVSAHIRDNPESLRGYQLLCDIYWEMGDYQAAVDLLKKSPESLRGSGSIMMLLGETYYQAGRYEAARDVFMDCGERFGGQEIISRALAKTYEAMGELDRARQIYGELLNQCTSCGARVDPFIKRRFAELSLKAGDTSTRVLEMFLSLVREDPDNRQEYYGRIGQIYEAAGNLKEARRYYGFSGATAG